MGSQESFQGHPLGQMVRCLGGGACASQWPAGGKSREPGHLGTVVPRLKVKQKPLGTVELQDGCELPDMDAGI